MVHDFKATVYDSNSGQAISVIGSSGSISRIVCYRGREAAIVTDVTVNGQQQVEQVATSSYTGRLIPTPNGSPSIVTGAKQPPSRIVFYPENGGLYETFDAYAWRNRWNDSSKDSSVWTTAPARLWHNHQQSHQLVSVVWCGIVVGSYPLLLFADFSHRIHDLENGRWTSSIGPKI
jgi:hypothetical protein